MDNPCKIYMIIFKILILIFGFISNHFISYATHYDWRLVGDLVISEKVTYHGAATVTGTKKKTGSELVYNLEVKDLHNFLVGSDGVMVHNSCILRVLIGEIKDAVKNLNIAGSMIKDKLMIPKGWIQKTLTQPDGFRYVHPSNPKIQIRVREKGTFLNKPHNYDKPYARYELGNDANGIRRHADIDGNMVDLNDLNYYEKTHFVIEKLATHND